MRPLIIYRAAAGCPKQDCIVVHPPSNIMEVKKTPTIGVKIYIYIFFFFEIEL